MERRVTVHQAGVLFRWSAELSAIQSADGGRSTRDSTVRDVGNNARLSTALIMWSWFERDWLFHVAGGALAVPAVVHVADFAADRVRQSGQAFDDGGMLRGDFLLFRGIIPHVVQSGRRGGDLAADVDVLRFEGQFEFPGPDRTACNCSSM